MKLESCSSPGELVKSLMVTSCIIRCFYLLIFGKYTIPHVDLNIGLYNIQWVCIQ